MGVRKNLLRVRMELKKYSMVPGSRRPFSHQVKYELFMKRILLKGLFFGLITITSGVDSTAQSFVNLNFESTTLPPDGPPSTVPTAIGLPGWVAFIAGTPQSTILYNEGTLGNSSIALLGGGSPGNP